MQSLLTRLALLLPGFFLTTALLASEFSPTHISGASTIQTNEAKSLFDNGTLFIDVRNDADWEAGRIPGAIHMDLKKTFSAASLNALAARDESIVIYCNGEKCLRSAQASVLAVEWGFSKIYYFREGFPAWKAAANPTE